MFDGLSLPDSAVARTNADAQVVSAVANDSQEVTCTASNFDNAFVAQIVLRN